MAKMTIQDKRIALAKDGTVSLPDADDTIVGKVVRDGKTWTALAADSAGKIGRAKTEHASRQAAFEALLKAHGIVPKS